MIGYNSSPIGKERALALRFDPFELDPETGEVRKGGKLVKLKPQPARVLALLASRAGNVVTRDEIQKALWPGETYVDFDLGINSCIRQIRAALEDDAEAPRYIQTVAKRGYRFIAVLENDEEKASSDILPSEIEGGGPVRWRRVLPWGLAALVVLAAGALGLRDRTLETRVLRAEISAPLGTRWYLASEAPGAPVLSPDGRQLAFSARDAEGKLRLYVRELDSSEARAVSGTERAQYPFWSPDGRHIGFFADQKLKKVEAAGGVPQTLADADNGKGGAWSRDDVILFSPEASVPSIAYRPPMAPRRP